MSITDILLFQNKQSDNYQLIGKGGFGRVFRVFNHLDNQYYAIKQIKVSRENINTALTEIRILAAISHPHIIRYHHSWISSESYHEMIMEEEDEEDDNIHINDNDTTIYFFNIQMEYCPSTLRTYLSERKVLDVSVCYKIIFQIVEGLFFLHENSIIHRDLKPDNILISSFQPFHIKITDFGLAKKIKIPHCPDASSYVGSCLYAAPELQEKQYFYASDIYSLGIIMFEIQHLFYTEMERILCIQDLKQKRKISCLYFSSLILSMTDPLYTQRPTLSLIKNNFIVDKISS